MSDGQAIGVRYSAWTDQWSDLPPVAGEMIGGPYDGIVCGMESAPDGVKLATCPSCGELHVFTDEFDAAPSETYVLLDVEDETEDSDPRRARYRWHGVVIAPQPRERDKVMA